MKANLPLITTSPARVLQRYNQGDTKNCIFYAFAWCLAWNTGDIMSESAILRMADRIKPWKPSVKLPAIHKEVEKYYDMHSIREDWSPYLKRWWGILVYIRGGKDFWMDVSDGKLEGNPKPSDWFDHSLWIHEVDGKIIAENTWASLQSFDITWKLNDLREKSVIVGMGYIFTKKVV